MHRWTYLAGLLVVLLMVPVGSATAHTRSNYYVTWWRSTQIPVHWAFDNDFPTAGTKRDRVKDAFDTWESAPGTLNFAKDAGDLDASSASCPAEGKSFVSWPILDGAGQKLAETAVCAFNSDPSKAKSFFIRVDRSEPWYAGTSTPPPDPGDVDLQAAITHEVGHVTGFGVNGALQAHFGQIWYAGDYVLYEPEYTNLCVTNPKHTMCPTMAPGTAYYRSLETHDLHTFENRYP